jgi:hypothetical protein
MRKNNKELVLHVYANSILVLFGIIVVATGYIMDYNMMVTVGGFLAGLGVFKVYNYYQQWKR